MRTTRNALRLVESEIERHVSFVSYLNTSRTERVNIIGSAISYHFSPGSMCLMAPFINESNKQTIVSQLLKLRDTNDSHLEYS